jgi:hypothetical protein
MAQRKSSINCMQGTPAGLPLGMPGMGLVMEGAMQQAAQWGRQDRALLMALFYRIGRYQPFFCFYQRRQLPTKRSANALNR